MSNVMIVRFGTGQIRVTVPSIASGKQNSILLQELVKPQRIGKLIGTNQVNPEVPVVVLEFTSKKSVDVMLEALAKVRESL